MSNHDEQRRTPATGVPFTVYDIQACLYDERRVEYLRDAIFKTVRDGDVVVDAGSGTGLLGLFAAQAGAARVYCVEVSDEFVPVIEANARNNRLGDRVVAVCADAATYRPDGPVDVLISEVISGGFFYEPQVQIINNLRPFLRDPRRVIPGAMNNYVELIDAQDKLYGLSFRYDSRFKELPGDRSLSTAARYLKTDFSAWIEPSVDAKVRVRAQRAGWANAIKVSYDVRFDAEVLVDKPTEFLLNPQIVFLDEPVRLAEGAEYEIGLAYEVGDSPLNSKIKVAQL